jgi:hypothetical protein
MVLKRLFQSPEVTKFAKSLAASFAADFSPSLPEGGGKEPTRRLTQATLTLCQKAQSYQWENKLGLYNKAKLSNVLKWELKDRGYHADLINEVIKSMLIAMAQKKKG